MKKLFDPRHQNVLQILMHPENQDALLQAIEKYKTEFGIPPSYYRLARLCQAQNRDVEAEDTQRNQE